MKILNLLFTLSLLVFLTSCGEDEEMNSGDNSFVGTWTADSFEADINTTTAIVGQAAQNTTVAVEGVDMDYTVQLDENPTTFMTNGSYGITGQITNSGVPDQTISDSYDNVSGTGSYRIEGDSLFTDGSLFDIVVNGMPVVLDQEETASKITLVDGKMVVEQDMITEDSPLPGFTTTTNLKSRSIWTKQ